jgi:hypothetical protein
MQGKYEVSKQIAAEAAMKPELLLPAPLAA